MQHQSSLFYVLFLLLAAMAGEYYVYLSIDPELALERGEQGVLLLLKMYGKAGVWCRTGFILFWPVWIMAHQDPLFVQGKRSRSYKFRLPGLAFFLLSAYLLFVVQELPVPFLYVLYPLAFLGVLLGGMCLPAVLSLKRSSGFGIRNEKDKVENAYSFNFKTKDGYINVLNPFRGIFISGAAGAGKSESLAYPIIHQAIEKGYTGLIYDFKFPVLAEQVHKALWESSRKDINFYLLNFHDLSRSHRVNPVKPERMPVMAYAEEYSLAILTNLWPETIHKKDFWIRSANALLTAVIWFLKKHHPDYCTIPHAVSIILYKDYLRTMSMLTTDPETAGMVQSVISAIENGAEGQIAGVIGSLQLSIARINSPEICWVLSGDDFNLDLNNPTRPKMLVIGADPALADTFSPLISCIITVALKLMNKAGKLPSLVLLDEAPTLYVPKLEMVPATARSNRIAVVYMAQDYSQMVDSYGKEKAEVMMANLNNQFYGRVSAAASSRMISDFFGKEEKEVESHSTSQSSWGDRRTSNQSVSLHKQEKLLIRPQDLSGLQVGEFTGTTVEGKEPYFKSRIRLEKGSSGNYSIQPFAINVQVEKNFEKVRAEAVQILLGYRKTLKKVRKQRK